MLARMEGPEFARFLRAFLPTARHAPFNYAAVIGMVVAPAVALIALDDPGGTPFVLTAIGLALTIAGPLLVSNRLSEPNYDAMLGWGPEAMPEGSEATRRRYFALNWIRAAATWAAFGLFLAALVELLLGRGAASLTRRCAVRYLTDMLSSQPVNDQCRRTS